METLSRWFLRRARPLTSGGSHLDTFTHPNNQLFHSEITENPTPTDTLRLRTTLSDCRSSCSGLAPDRPPASSSSSFSTSSGRQMATQKSADLSRVAAVDARLMADEEEEEEEGRNVCINVTLQLRTPLRELHAAASAHARSRSNKRAATFLKVKLNWGRRRRLHFKSVWCSRLFKVLTNSIWKCVKY